MRARDIMTRDVITVPAATPVEALAQLLADRHISAVPVVDPAGALLGIVTEADLMFRLMSGLRRHAGWLSGMVIRPSEEAANYARLHGRTARDVMTTSLVTTTEDTPVEELAVVMRERRIKRLPVLRDGRLVGIVSRADLLRAVLTPPGSLAADAPDARIRARITAAMQEQPWADTLFTWPDVRDGVVTFFGYCRSAQVERGLRVLAEGIPGVRRVEMKTEPAPAIPLGVG